MPLRLFLARGSGMGQAIAFIAVSVVGVGLSLLAFLTLGSIRLDSPLGMLRDGLANGTVAPGWQARDLDGELHVGPTPAGWQLLVFGDHALAPFDDLLGGIRFL